MKIGSWKDFDAPMQELIIVSRTPHYQWDSPGASRSTMTDRIDKNIESGNKLSFYIDSFVQLRR
jgi:hypothetical protein